MKVRARVEFSGEHPLIAWMSWSLPLHRLVITDENVRVEARWRFLNHVLTPRSTGLAHVASARLRGTLVILYLVGDEWWSVSAGMKCEKLMRELEARGVPTT